VQSARLATFEKYRRVENFPNGSEPTVELKIRRYCAVVNPTCVIPVQWITYRPRRAAKALFATRLAGRWFRGLPLKDSTARSSANCESVRTRQPTDFLSVTVTCDGNNLGDTHVECDQRGLYSFVLHFCGLNSWLVCSAVLASPYKPTHLRTAIRTAKKSRSAACRATGYPFVPIFTRFL
jgi:hypothetical protein